MDERAPSDAELIERVAGRDADAYTELHRRTARATLGLALRARPEWDDAVAATRESSRTIWGAAVDFAGVGAEDWLLEHAAATVGANAGDQRAGRSWRAHRALSTMPDGERQVVELTAWGGLSVDDAAAFLNASREVVQAALDSALPRLATAVGAALEGPAALRALTDPPAELPPELERAPDPPRQDALPVARRYRSTLVVGAVILGLVLFGVGWLLGGGGGGRQEVRSYELRGEDGASGEVVLYRADDAGNWPLTVAVSGLPAERATAPYELWLTDGGAPTQAVGAFRAHDGEAEVELSVPTQPAPVDGWAVLVQGTGEPVLRSTGPGVSPSG